MIALLTLLTFLQPAASSFTFEETDIPGLRVSAVNPLSGVVATNYRQADLDGNGKLDLLLPGGVFFQRAAGFSDEDRVPIPGATERPHCDLWGDTIYLWSSDRLSMIHWEAGAWETVADQALRRPENIDAIDAMYLSDITLGTPSTSSASGAAANAALGVRFDRFLHDFDGDGTPEMVVPGEKGVYVYSKGKNGYTETVCLDILPPLRFFQPPRQPLWPPESRQIAFPGRAMTCRFVLEGNRLTTIAREDGPDTRIVYRVRRYTLDVKDGGSVLSDTVHDSVTEPLPAHFRPCRLNGDDLIDYAGGDWELSTSSPLPMPIYETSASTDNGKTLQSVRTPSFRPQCSFVDFDGDGDLDMIAESTGLFDGGTRECVSRMLSSKHVKHEIAVHLQNGQGVFSRSPDVRGRFTVTLDAPPSRGGPMFQRYQSAELFDISGDFNRDRRRDVVVQDRPRRLAIFLSKSDTFSARPDALLNIPKNARFGVADVDGDGRSDIVVRWYVSDSDEMIEHSRVHFTREGTP